MNLFTQMAISVPKALRQIHLIERNQSINRAQSDNVAVKKEESILQNINTNHT